jgi:hypothetical protein
VACFDLSPHAPMKSVARTSVATVIGRQARMAGGRWSRTRIVGKKHTPSRDQPVARPKRESS